MEIRVEVPLHAAHEIAGNVAERAAVGLVGEKVLEPTQRHAAGTALIHQGRDAGAHAHQIGIETEFASHMLVDMGMGVDEPRRDDLAGDVDFL